MARVGLRVADVDVRFECRALRGREALGEVLRLEIEVVAAEPVDAQRMLRKPCEVLIEADVGERVVHGIVVRVVAMATAQAESARRYEVAVRSAVHRLALRRRTRVFQHLTVPAIVQAVLHDAGFDGQTYSSALTSSYDEREYVVQYAEDDLSFLRRLCEEEGLYFRFEPRGGFDAFVLEDSSRHATPAGAGPLPLVDDAALAAGRAIAWEWSERRGRRAGRVVLRDHDHQHPAALLEGRAAAGSDVEQGIEVYEAPGRFLREPDGAARARTLLEAHRADSRTIQIRTTELALAPGLSFELKALGWDAAAHVPDGQHLVVSLDHEWRADAPRYEIGVTAIPADVPYRLPRRAPRPRIAGLHPAVVTGPKGEEIHVDAAGRVRVRFFWDREGPTDGGSSLPVRVMQPNLGGAMLIPRVGWEVIVAFEDGDPNRPVIVGRAYNARRPPPFALPVNKTVTSLASPSSPGGRCENAIHFDDAAGRQHMSWSAGSGKTTVVANNMVTQTVGNEVCAVGSQTFTIGGSESLSVKAALGTSAASQSLSVGGSQTVRVTADMGISTGSEAVSVGALLFERVGDPIKGVIALAEAAAIEAVSAKLGSALEATKKLGPMAKAIAQHALGPGLAAIQGGIHGGLDGDADAAATDAALAAAQAALGHIPGMDAVTAAAMGAGRAPWEPASHEDGGAAAPGGGAGAPSASAGGAAGPGPGHRVTNVGAAMTEVIGGPHGILTPGMVRWTTLGPSLFVVGGSHNIQAANVSARTMGASVDRAASQRMNAIAGDVARVVKTSAHRTVAGSLKCSAGKDYRLKAGGSLNIKLGGGLSLSGGIVVFHCGSSSLSVSSGGVLLKANNVTINGKAQQSGKASTP